MQLEKEATFCASQTSAKEMEKLLSAMTSLTEERDQLKMDLQENIEMVSSNIKLWCFVFKLLNFTGPLILWST